MNTSLLFANKRVRFPTGRPIGTSNPNIFELKIIVLSLYLLNLNQRGHFFVKKS